MGSPGFDAHNKIHQHYSSNGISAPEETNCGQVVTHFPFILIACHRVFTTQNPVPKQARDMIRNLFSIQQFYVVSPCRAPNCPPVVPITTGKRATSRYSAKLAAVNDCQGTRRGRKTPNFHHHVCRSSAGGSLSRKNTHLAQQSACMLETFGGERRDGNSEARNMC